MPKLPPRFCCDEELELLGYDGHHAAQDLAAWQSRGPSPATQELIDVIRAQGVDVVTLDSVICCYPYLSRLLQAAVRPGPRLVGLTYPLEAWWMRLAMTLYNARSALLGWPEHYFIHRRAEIDRLMGEFGFVTFHRGGTRFWRVVAYRRNSDGH